VSRRILIVAGETSGDGHGARLARALLALDPALDLSGMGGEAMRAAGVRTIVDSRELSVMGFGEVGAAAVRVLGAYRALARALKSSPPPDLLIVIDFPDFNLRLAAAARRLGVRVLYYVSPQVWAWRSGRIAKICRVVDRMIVLFPFEVDLYRSCGLDARFVGHPSAEEVAPTRTPEETLRRWSLRTDLPLVALLPGSRRAEVARMLPLMLAAAERLKDRATFAVAKAPDILPGLVETFVAQAGASVATVENDTYNLVAAARAAAVTSGTATLECALLGCPMAVVYRMSPVSFAIARRLVRVPFIALPNIVLGERVVPELVQHAATPEALAREISAVLTSAPKRANTVAQLAEIGSRLRMPGAATRAAELALEMIR
jgi:lipid-A-disaccharide synthase